MPLSTRLYCTLQQFCAFLFIMGPFWYFSTRWMIANHPGSVTTAGSLWDTASFAVMFFGLLMLLDNVCTWLNNEFKNEY